jgi:hypothetical protein
LQLRATFLILSAFDKTAFFWAIAFLRTFCRVCQFLASFFPVSPPELQHPVYSICTSQFTFPFCHSSSSLHFHNCLNPHGVQSVVAQFSITWPSKCLSQRQQEFILSGTDVRHAKA